MMLKEIEKFVGFHAALGRSEQTLYHYRRRLQYFWDFLQGQEVYDIRNVTAGHVRAYHDYLCDKNMNPASRHGYLNTVQAFFRWLHEQEQVLCDISSRIELPRLDKSLPPRVLTHDEVRVMLGSINTATLMGKRDYAMVQVLYGCGLRRTELIRLNVRDVDALDHTVFVHGKGNKDRVVPINEAALQAVAAYLEAREHRKKGSPLFLTPINRRIHTQVLQKLFSDLSAKLSRKVYPHLLRHTFAVHLLRGGADVRHVQIMLGHSSPNTTSRYLGLVRNDLKQEYDRAMGGVMSGVTGGVTAE